MKSPGALSQPESPEEMLRQLQQQLAETQHEVSELKKRLEAANKELEVFSYSVSHDLRAPLRHLHGWATALQEDCQASLDARGREYLSHLTQSVEQMSSLINALLLFARTAMQPLNREEIVMDELVREVIADLKPQEAERKIKWQLHALPIVFGDRSLLRQVWTHLIGNALKYTRPQAVARIEIGTAKPENHEVVFFIRDNGAGFEMKRADRLFGLFQRLHRREEFDGAGVGLAHVRRIISRHDGRTWAFGEVGQGATFHFSLPKHSS